MATAFSISRLPQIRFGAGRFRELPDLVRDVGERALLVTGRRSFADGPRWPELAEALKRAGVSWQHVAVSGEPSPALVDETVAGLRSDAIEVVVGIGGGSVLDTAKAVAGLLVPGNSVRDHLEGVGPQLPYRGPAVPFIAVPTTAGTGSEATKNAVLSERGASGFKKSFRDDSLVARLALVDSELLAGCPKALIAANGMDALTQLIEPFVSTRANPFTDALALSGLEAARDGLRAWFGDPAGPGAAAARDRMAYAALCSGICLAQAGLGAVHGLASPLGALFPVPHGVACGAVLASATQTNVAALEARGGASPALSRYAVVGRLLTGRTELGEPEARAALVSELEAWRAELAIEGLSAYGVAEADVAAIVADARGSSMRTNPIELSDPEIAEIVRASI